MCKQCLRRMNISEQVYHKHDMTALPELVVDATYLTTLINYFQVTKKILKCAGKCKKKNFRQLNAFQNYVKYDCVMLHIRIKRAINIEKQNK